MSKGFQFKQFYVAHDRCAMKVGTDGVLLGATAPIGGPRVLDIGTGTGLVSLMIAQRIFSFEPNGSVEQHPPLWRGLGGVDAIDIVPEAVEQARENFANSPWSAHLHAYQSSLQDWYPTPPMPTAGPLPQLGKGCLEEAGKGLYDLIVSNPPYFVDSLKNPDKNRETARHTDTLSYEDLIKHSKRLLAPDGVLQLILPIEAEQEIRRIAAAYDLYPTYTLYIRTTPTKSPKRFIIRFSPTPPSSQVSPHAADSTPPLSRGGREGSLTLMGPNGEPRSQEYQELMKDFYL